MGEFRMGLTIVWGYKGENVRGGVEESYILYRSMLLLGHMDAKWANLVPVGVRGWDVLLGAQE